MIRKMMGYDKKEKAKKSGEDRGEDDEYTFGKDRVSDDGTEDNEAHVVRKGGMRSSLKKSTSDLKHQSGKKKRVTVRDDQDGDTPPTRSRSRKRRARFGNDNSPEDFDFESEEGDEETGFFGGKKKGGMPKTLSVNDIKKKHGITEANLDKLGGKKGSKLTAERLDLMDRSKSRSKSGVRNQKSVSLGRDITYNQGSPKREIYEAKFEKYITNKRQKDNLERRMKAFEKPDFDVTTKNPQSPSKKSNKYTTVVGAELSFKPSGKYETNNLMPEEYDDYLLREEQIKLRNKDPFKFLGVSNDDKMAFFLLKWVFNAIKRVSEPEDKELKGMSYVTKKDLVKNLVQNDEVMASL